MPSQLLLKEDSEIVLDHTISLKKFPLNLRKVARVMLESDEPMRIKEACARANVNYSSFRTQVTKCRQRGIDFYKFIEEQAITFLREEKFAVNKSLVKGAVSGSHNHQKLYYQLTGDLKEAPNLSINHLTIGVNIESVQVQDDREMGVIDVEPFIPKGK